MFALLFLLEEVKTSPDRKIIKRLTFAIIWQLVSATTTSGSFSNDDGDGNEDVKMVKRLLRKTTTLHVHHTFWYISLPS